MPFVFHYLWWSHALFFKRLVLSPCCWELCTACSGVAMLHCLLNQQFSHSRASFSSTCQGLFWWHHHCCHSHCGPTPLGKEEVSWTAAHACLLVPLPNTEVSPIRSPCSVALQQQIILDGFILITSSLIFFLSPQRHATLPAKYSTSGCTRASLSTCICTQGNRNTHVDICMEVCFCTIWRKTYYRYAAWLTLMVNTTFQWERLWI